MPESDVVSVAVGDVLIERRGIGGRGHDDRDRQPTRHRRRRCRPSQRNKRQGCCGRQDDPASKWPAWTAHRRISVRISQWIENFGSVLRSVQINGHRATPPAGPMTRSPSSSQMKDGGSCWRAGRWAGAPPGCDADGSLRCKGDCGFWPEEQEACNTSEHRLDTGRRGVDGGLSPPSFWSASSLRGSWPSELRLGLRVQFPPRQDSPEPFAGTPQFEHVAPIEITDEGQPNQPLGQPLADEIAREIGLKKSDVLTQAQYRAFITGQGRDGSGNLASAELVDQSVKIFTNTIGHPLAYKDENGRIVTSVLASYGLFVTTSRGTRKPGLRIRADVPREPSDHTEPVI